jgi:hypothetical protein
LRGPTWGARRGAPADRCGRRAVSRGMGLVLAVMGAVGCELAEVTVAEPEELVVAEIYFRVEDDRSDAIALLHRTTGFAGKGVEGAGVRVRRPGGAWVAFTPEADPNCIEAETPESFVPNCFVLPPSVAGALVFPGARLEVEVDLPDGGGMRGAVSVPGEFRIHSPSAAPGTCTLTPETLLPLSWSPAEGAWAYLPEAEILGLRNALAPRGVVVRTDPVTLQGLAISQSDTSIVFPSQFGVFNRFSDDRELLLAIQGGIPENVSVYMVVSALDRNATNWVRGGAFNPSGQIRIPSLFGDGTRVVGAVVNRAVAIRSEPPGETLPVCRP